MTPYGSISGLFQSGDDYQLSNDMKVDGQSYDSMRYELGVDAGYTFTYSEDQALTPYFKLAYVYDDSNNDNDVNEIPSITVLKGLRYVLVWVLSSASPRTSAPIPMLTTSVVVT